MSAANQKQESPTDFSAVGFVKPVKGLKEQFLRRTGYVVSYNSDTRCPNWVAWRLTANHTDGPIPRPGNAFHEDEDVPSPRACNSDFRGSGYSRGHLCPCGDNKWDSDAMYESFLLSNVCPQNGNLNQGLWNQIEISCRRWAQRYGSIYIISGPMFFRSKGIVTVGDNAVAVPDAFFKVVLRMSPTPKAIGFICRNTDGNRSRDMYVNSLSQVERITGFSFFPRLSSDVKNSIASSASLSDW